MSNFDFEKFYKSLNTATTREKVDTVFKDVFDLPAAERAAVAQALEKKFLNFIESLKEEVLSEGVAATEKWVHDTSLMSPMNPDYDHDLMRQQKLMQIRVNVGKLLGKDASVLSKAFNTAAAALTEEELKSSAVREKPLLAVIKAITQQGPCKP